jgi:hypothetical protein
MNYVANAERHDVVRAMYEFIEASKEKWALHIPDPSEAAKDEELARARQLIAEQERQIMQLERELARFHPIPPGQGKS